MPVAQPASPLVAAFDIFINGSPLSVEQESHVVDVQVELDGAIPSMFSLTLSGSASRADDLSWLDDTQLFALGNEVDIRLGYADDLGSVMVGELTGLEPEFSCDRPPSLTLRGYDRRHRLQRGHHTRTFTQLKDSDIASQMAAEAGLTAQVQDSRVTHGYLLQSNQTNLAFLQERARLIQYELMVDNKTLRFRPVGNADGAALTLTLEADLLSFSPRLSAMQQVNRVVVQGWNVQDKAPFTGQATTGDESSTMGGQTSGGSLANRAFGTAVAQVVNLPVSTQAEVDQLAKARLNRTGLHLIDGEGSCWGRTDLKPGQVITLEGLGQRFSGQYYVTAVSHRYRPDRGYVTGFRVRRNAV
ncbi:phage late control D family protein [Nodosilinea sp. PGN35]|uniref:phage late control D family protein n=1 Tax=Nodosilinea sp. PGN35 TaxID=3020489 RepID=UPI0023B34525|nr:contractile injection system protein, VgrG/Pvc8 family [Nodosilinea sp. TSF1-S3]MDF0367886.1 hypothetical protein [Nodosilinea sp. TSF1-S3]